MGKPGVLLIEFIFFCFFASGILAQSNTTYSVISVTSKHDIGVLINDEVYKMKPVVPGSVLLHVEAPGNRSYKYVKIDSKTNKIAEKEPFVRPAREENVVNEFYGRQWTVKPVKQLPSLDLPVKYNRIKTDLHPEGEIPTIHITALQTDIDNLHTHYLNDVEIIGNVTYISASTMKELTGVEISIGGRASRLLTKLPYNFKVPKGQDLFGYRKFKIRTTANDPSYIREYLTAGARVAASVPCSQESYVRVIINQREMGLFVFAEKIEKKWLENEFGGGKSKYEIGYLYEGAGGNTDKTRSSLEYLGENPEDYTKAEYVIDEKPKVGTNTLDDLVTFIKFIHDQKAQQASMSAAQIDATADEWEKKFDVETFLTNMAFDFITGSWDEYLMNTDNYFLYQLPEDGRFVYISWDFDFVIGNGPVDMKAIIVGDYNYYGGVKVRPLMVAVLNVPKFRKFFEDRISLLVDKLFDPKILNPVIDSLADFLHEDVSWDKSLPRARSGLSFIPLNSPQAVLDLLGNNKGNNKKTGTPLCLSILNALEYVGRANVDVPFEKAIEGKTGHTSLYGVKEWFHDKLDNIERKTKYKSPLIPLR